MTTANENVFANNRALADEELVHVDGGYSAVDWWLGVAKIVYTDAGKLIDQFQGKHT